MSWLKQPSSSSLKESSSRPKTATNSSPSSSSAGRNSQNTVTRILACGTVYLTHTLSVPSSIINPSVLQDAEDVPDDSLGSAKTTSVRAKQVSTQRGGPAVNVLSILAQFSHGLLRPPTTPNRHPAHPAQIHRPVIECALVSPLGSDAAGRALMHELELEGIRTRFCKVHPTGVPAAFVLRSDDSPSRTIINHNPLPELTHEDFVTILGPILVPEHYHGIATHQWHPHPSVPQLPPVHAVFGPGPGLPPLTTQPAYATSTSSPQNVQLPTTPLPSTTPGLPSNAPFTIFHMTGRAPAADAITLMNLTGVDGLARDRLWRDKCTFSFDCTAPIANEQAKHMPEYVDPVTSYEILTLGQSVNLSTPIDKLTPRSFLLSQVPFVAPHALLFVFWDHDGGALLSVPTREYLQSSIWTESTPQPSPAPDTPVISVEQKEQHRASYPPLNPAGDIRPETTLSLGSSDPRYQEFDTISSNRHGDGRNGNNRQIPSQWASPPSETTTSEGPLSPGILPSRPPSGNVLDHIDAQGRVDSPGFSEYGFQGFPDTTPDTSWDYRANRTAVIYDSGDDSETDYGEAFHGQAGYSRGAHNLALQMNVAGNGGVIINEGVALSPSDVDSDVDVSIAAGARRFVMEERMRRVYGPLEGDQIESDALDSETPDHSADHASDSDVTESGERGERGQPGRHEEGPMGPTRIGRLKRERLREQEQHEQERLQALELQSTGRRSNDSADTASIRSNVTAPPPPKPLPPIPPYVIEAWQAGLIFALTRHVLPGRPYTPTISATRSHENLKAAKKIEAISSSDWAWKWRLDECLRFAAELAGRRARKPMTEGLAREMEESGWLS